VNGTLFFSATDGTHGTELWRSDGTTAGTVLLADINPGSTSSNPAWLTVSGTNLFFAADDGVHGVEPWVLSLSSAATTAAGADRGRQAPETPATRASGGVLAGPGARVVGTGSQAFEVTPAARATLWPRSKGLAWKSSRVDPGGTADDFQAGVSGWPVVMGPATSPAPPPAGLAPLVVPLPESDPTLMPTGRRRARVVPEMIDRFLAGLEGPLAI
jgi:ELWxxDGT repeat protein